MSQLSSFGEGVVEGAGGEAGGDLVGLRVQLAGLVLKREMNGQSGTATAFDAGRYSVLMGDGTVLNLKPSNMVAAPNDTPPDITSAAVAATSDLAPPLPPVDPPPQDLPSGWVEASTEDGVSYYANTLTGETSWERPQKETPHNPRGDSAPPTAPQDPPPLQDPLPFSQSVMQNPFEVRLTLTSLQLLTLCTTASQSYACNVPMWLHAQAPTALHLTLQESFSSYPPAQDSTSSPAASLDGQVVWIFPTTAVVLPTAAV